MTAATIFKTLTAVTLSITLLITGGCNNMEAKKEETLHKIAVWMRVCAGWADSQDMLIIRFGDQMNNVAVTDGDKVERCV